MIDTVYDEEHLRDFLEVAHEKRDRLREFIDALTPGREEPRREDDLLDEMIESIAIVPDSFRKDHQALLVEGRYFDAQDFEMTITLRRYQAVKNADQLLEEEVEGQRFLYGKFDYEEGVGPAF